MANNQSWAPQSPDLSGYTPQSPDISAYSKPPSQSTIHLNTSWAPQSPDIAAFQGSEYNQHPHFSQPQPSQFTLDSPWDTQRQDLDDQYSGLQYHQNQQQPLYHQSPPPQHQHQQQYFFPDQQHQQQLYNDMPAQTRRGQRVSYKEEDANDAWSPELASRPAARGKQAPKLEPEESSFSTKPIVLQETPKMDTQGIEVKTKFPTARIKRIMQADEDVGKVAQVTPVVMAKALELFMIRLITASAGVARQRGSKRVQTAHMKAAVMQDDQFDNLREILAKVPDAPTRKGGEKEEDDDEDEGEAGPKKRKKSAGGGGGRGKKRRDSDDDF